MIYVTTQQKKNPLHRVLQFVTAASVCLIVNTACASQQIDEPGQVEGTQQIDTSAVPDTILIPSGPFIFGSSSDEREYGYLLDEAAYGHKRTREGNWYEREADVQQITTSQFYITTTPVTNSQYFQFVKATGHPAPDVDEATWQGYRLVHPYERTRRHAWSDDSPPTGREEHPVVLVSHNDAQAYAKWLSSSTGHTWRLPSEIEWVKAARGDNGNIFPWGNTFAPDQLNSHDQGPFDTVPVGSRSVANTYGLIDAAGQVFEWIQATPDAQRAWVKGGSWDDKGCGVCRPAARHSRPIDIKHILIGFRLVKE